MSKEAARSHFGLSESKLTFLVFGGSQGAQTINRLFCESLNALKKAEMDFQVIHIVGKPERAEKLQEVYPEQFIVLDISALNSNTGVETILDFAGVPKDNRIVLSGIRLNRR